MFVLSVKRLTNILSRKNKQFVANEEELLRAKQMVESLEKWEGKLKVISFDCLLLRYAFSEIDTKCRRVAEQYTIYNIIQPAYRETPRRSNVAL